MPQGQICTHLCLSSPPSQVQQVDPLPPACDALAPGALVLAACGGGVCIAGLVMG